MLGPVRLLCLIAFLFAAVPGSLAQTPGSASPADASAKDQTELRAVIEKFFELYAKEDLEGLMKLWSEESPDYAERRKAMAESFTKEDYSFSSLSISKVRMEGDKASLRATAVMKVVSPQPRQERMIRNIYFVREQGAWKIWRDAPAAKELAENLLAANEDNRKALLSAEPDLVTPELVTAIQARGDGTLGMGEFDKAREAYHLSEAIARSINDRPGMTTAWNKTGISYARQGLYDQALEFLQKAMTGFKELDDSLGMAKVLTNIGIIHAEQGRHEQALAAHQQNLQLYQSLSYGPGLAATHLSIANIHAYQGRYAQALEGYQQSIQLNEELQNLPGVAIALGNVGNIHFYQGRYRQALDAYLKNLSYVEKLGNRAAAADTIGNIGGVYERQGRLDQALEFYKKSLQLSESQDYKIGISAASINIGNVYEKQGLYEQALKEFHSTLNLSEKLNVPADIAICLNNIGNIQMTLQRYDQAQEAFEKCLQIREKLNDPAGIANALINVGSLYYFRNLYEKALEHFLRAGELAEAVGAPELLYRAHLNSGRTYLRLNRLDEARKAFSEAINIVEKLREDVAGGELDVQSFFEGKAEAYSEMSDLLVSRNETAEALTFAERAKARTLLDVLQSGRINVAGAMTAQEREQEDKLRTQLVSLNAQAFRERQREKPDQERLKDLEAQRAKGQLALDDFQSQLYASHRKLKVQRGEVKPLSMSEAQSLLPDDKTALLEFAVTEDKTLLFVLTKVANASSTTPDLKVFSIPIKAKDLTDRAEKFRRVLAGKDIGFKKEATALYDLLLKPAQAALQGKSSLIIAPDGPLWELPFQALASGANRFLIEDAAISYAPSLTYLLEMNRKRASGQGRAQRTLLAIGNPALAQQTVARAQIATRSDDKLEPLQPLPMAKEEAQALANLYGLEQSKVYIGADAMEDRFKAEAGEYRILHLATHGILNNSSPMYSQVLFSQSGNNEKEDGLLEAWEIMNLDLKADLVVLSACETARGRIGAGEGVIGLTWALFVAGVPATVVSQWKVMDASTQQLMVEFHRQLKTKPAQGKAEALRQATLKVMKQPRANRPHSNHPYYWAPFVLVGASR